MISVGNIVQLKPEFMQSIGPSNEKWVHEIGEVVEIKGKVCVVRFKGGDVKRIIGANLERVLANTCLPDGQPSQAEIAVRRLEIIVEACSLSADDLADRQRDRREWAEEFDNSLVPLHWARRPFDIKKS